MMKRAAFSIQKFLLIQRTESVLIIPCVESAIFVQLESNFRAQYLQLSHIQNASKTRDIIVEFADVSIVVLAIRSEYVRCTVLEFIQNFLILGIVGRTFLEHCQKCLQIDHQQMADYFVHSLQECRTNDLGNVGEELQV